MEIKAGLPSNQAQVAEKQEVRNNQDVQKKYLKKQDEVKEVKKADLAKEQVSVKSSESEGFSAIA